MCMLLIMGATAMELHVHSGAKNVGLRLLSVISVLGIFADSKQMQSVATFSRQIESLAIVLHM